MMTRPGERFRLRAGGRKGSVRDPVVRGRYRTSIPRALCRQDLVPGTGNRGSPFPTGRARPCVLPIPFEAAVQVALEHPRRGTLGELGVWTIMTDMEHLGSMMTLALLNFIEFVGTWFNQIPPTRPNQRKSSHHPVDQATRGEGEWSFAVHPPSPAIVVLNSTIIDHDQFVRGQ